MKHFSLLPCLFAGAVLLAPAVASAQFVTIAQARAAGVNATVSVRGVVINGPELGVIRYVQDATAGLAVYSPTLSATQVGDSIELTGTLKNYNGLLEMDPVQNFTVLASGRVVTPVAVPMANAATVYAEQYEGMLVRVNANTSLTTTAGAAVSTFSGNTNYNLNGLAATAIRTNSASTGPDGIVGKPAPTAGFDLIGVMSQFSPTGTGGYQLLPRLYADFVLGGAPNIQTLPVPSDIGRTSMTLSFTTQNAGDGRIEYGSSPTSLTQMALSTATGTQHSVTLSGLQPATVYYVRAVSTNAIGTSTSAVVPVITESLSSGRMRAWFNNPVNTTYAWPATNQAQYFNNTIDDSVAVLMGRAVATMDVMIYNWNNLVILNAINSAHRRGVQVRIIIDGGASGNSTQGLDATIPIIARVTSAGIMHNKIILIDADHADPNVPLVWTGATNWTAGQLNTDRNNVIIVQDQSLARVYQMEFNEMWGSTTATPGTPKYGPQKADNTPHYLKIGGKAVESWFSPSDNVTAKLIETIQTAQNDLHFATMVLTRSDIAVAIRNQVQSQNIAQCSEGLINDTTTGPYFTVQAALGNRLRHYSKTNIMHHKYLLVDAGGSDPITWTGSHNWSNNAANNNDENTLVIHDAAITNQYYQEFAQRMIDENIGITLCQLRVTGLPADYTTATRVAAQVYPNPSGGAFRVASAANGPVQVSLFDLNGRCVWQTTTTAAADQSISVEAAALPAGLYHLRLESAAGTQFGRVSVVK